MQNFNTKKIKSINKFLTILIFLSIGLLGFLIYLLSNKLNNNVVLNLGDLNKVYASFSDPWQYPGRNCRYRTGGNLCALSEFRGCNPGNNQICVCSANEILGNNNLTYGNFELRSIDQYVTCGAPDANERNRVCQALRNGQNPGGNYNVQDAGNVWIVRGVAPACQNPYRFDCPKPELRRGQINVRAVCVENGEQVSVFVEMYRNSPDPAYGNGYTPTSLNNTIEGRTYGIVFRSDVGESGRGFPELQRRYPNVQFDAARSGFGSRNSNGHWEANVPYNANVTMYFTGCVTPTPTPTPTPEPNPVCDNIVVTNRTTNRTCGSNNPQECGVARGHSLTITVNGRNGNNYAISQAEFYSNNTASSSITPFGPSNVFETSVSNNSQLTRLEITGYVRRGEVSAPNNPACRVVFDIAPEPTPTPTPTPEPNPVCDNIVVRNTANGQTCRADNPQACNVTRGNVLEVTINGRNADQYGVLVSNNYFDGRNVATNPNFTPQNTFSVTVPQDNNLSATQINGIVRRGTQAAPENDACVIRFTFNRLPEPAPGVSIRKTLISPNPQLVGNVITFGITVTNTGNVDLTNFELIDEYDPEYLRFVRAYTQVGNAQREVTQRSVRQINVDGRTRNQIIWNIETPLLRGQTYTLNLEFEILREVSPNIRLENDNCGVVSRITYRRDGQDVSQTIQDVRDCAEFNTRRPNDLVLRITKRTLDSPINVGSVVRFEAVLINNDSESRSYDVINFRDRYDSGFLRPSQVEISKGNRRAVVNADDGNLPNNGVIAINNVQNLVANDGSPLGGLNRGESYTFIIHFVAVAPINNTCDTVWAEVTNNSQQVRGRTNEAEACAEIIAPKPPKTGVSMIWNLIVPIIAMVAAINIRRFVVNML